MRFTQSSVLALAAIVPPAVNAEGSQSILQQESARQLNESLLWGTYRPNLYFGVKPRIPKSFAGGLMWSKVESYSDVQHCMYLNSSLLQLSLMYLCTEDKC